ncbi:sulfatase-like hydrolase/transferase [Rubritalea spongiae]|uniref:Sulfatase-like hydrolase/transferase n=1 Tax=Rubritalea spongiae TaxID=430797 RepID=A0ABW5E306_9BACT
MKKLILSCAIALFSLCTAQAATSDKPNLIFIYADDWGYGDIGAHGSTFCKTPQLDKMIEEGTDFQNFSVVNPVCSPSRVAIMTGHYPARHSVHRHFATLQHHKKTGMPDWLDPKAVMLPRLLQQGGYKTAHYGKWHLTNVDIDDAPLPDQYGYDDYKAFNLPGPNAPADSPIPNALKFIEENKEKPFFINLWIHETHTPHYPKPEFEALHPELNDRQKVYAAIVSEGDTGVGKILAKLKELEIDKNTLVIFSSDNGPERTGAKKITEDASTGPGKGSYYSVGETAGLRGQKRSLNAGGVRVPFIAWWPGTVPAGKIDKTTTLAGTDILPTFCSLAGVTLPEDYQADGVDITSALKGENFERNKPVYWDWRAATGKKDFWASSGIAEGKWKLLHNKKLKRTELYDMTVDFKERKDLSKQNPELVEKLLAKITAWQKTLPDAPPADCISKHRN